MRHKTKISVFGWQPETEFFVSINERRKMNKFYKAMVRIRMMVATAGMLLYYRDKIVTAVNSSCGI
ncbi:MAG: hypothetical protein BWK80_51520 [Desulfobacteraceae bacterium IS3]|nr:MAG: hypothetical protein BWK80_51520 [Desulfobacteraceae bacterium IS3]